MSAEDGLLGLIVHRRRASMEPGCLASSANGTKAHHAVHPEVVANGAWREAGAGFVAQIFNLPYRRLQVGRAW